MGKAFVMAERVVVERNGGFGRDKVALRFFARKLDTEPGVTPRNLTIAWTEDQCVRSFETFEEAERVVEIYNAGPGEGAIAARWDSEACEWVITEEACARSRGDREDFHADG